jgi:CelD/BcsL family acetyltransferase involved in cellulose biosynthesis
MSTSTIEYAVPEHATPRTGRAGVRVVVADTLEGLTSHADAWDRLALAAAWPVPTVSYAWVASYLEHQLAPGETWRCLFAYEHETLLAVLPLIRTHGRTLGLDFTRLAPPMRDHSRTGDILLGDPQRDDVLRALMEAVDRLEPSRFCLTLGGVPDGSGSLRLLATGVPRSIVVPTRDGIGSFVPVRGTYRDFEARLSRNFVKNLKRWRNKLAKLPAVRARFLGREADPDAELARFMAIEASGWKGRAGTALGCSAALIRFYSRLVHRLAERDWLEWHFLEADGRPIAGHLAVRMGRSLALWKVGYDESFAACAPGNMLFERCVERAFAKGDTDVINFLTDTPFTQNWRMERYAYHNLWIYPRRALPVLTGALPKQARLLARRLPGLRWLVARLRARRAATAATSKEGSG